MNPFEMRKTFFTAFLILGLFSVVLLNAQTEKFGKIKPDILKLTQDPDFPDASAVILFDVGTVKINYVNEDFEISQERHVRIKIFTKAGYDYANVTLPRYLKNREKFMKVSAVVYNLDAKGKVVKEKVESNQIFDEDIDNRINRKRFTFPSVSEGCVIEYKYQLVSNKSFRIVNWDFQHEIPVKYSEFDISYPVYFTYLIKYQGKLPFAKREENTRQETFTHKEVQNVSLGSRTTATQREISHSSFDMNFKTFLYVMKNVPPMVEEPFISTMEDYRAKLIHQYKAFQVPPNAPYNYITDWSSFVERMHEDSDWGGQLRMVNTFKKELNEITNENASELDNMVAIYDYARETLNWNGLYRIFPNTNLTNAFNRKDGNSSDINMLLTYFLQKAGFESYPVMISTRLHGKIDKAFPILNQFNSVINLTVINGKNYFLDATDPLRPYNLLDETDIYGVGLVINKYEFNWIQISNTFKSKELVSATIKISGDGEMSGSIEASQTGYYALKSRISIIDNGKEEFFNNEINDGGSASELTIEKVDFENDVDKPLMYKIGIESGAYAQVNGDMIYIKPMLFMAYDQNPFKTEKRDYPINFGYSRDQTYMLNLTIPEGYEVVELPESMKSVLPDNGGVFYFICKNIGTTIQLNSKINLNRTKYTVEEYLQLKSLFDMIVAKQAEQIVLKKIGVLNGRSE